MKKLLFLIAAVLCITMVAACSNPSADTPPEEDTPMQTPTQAPSEEISQATPTEQPAPETPTPEAIPSNISPELSAEDLVKNIAVGWNLGNTFDASGAAGSRLEGAIASVETSWLGGTAFETTQSLIAAVKSHGFDSIRIPITWNKVSDPDNNWEIRADWLARIKQVVDWSLEEGLYVIINSHHDNHSLQLGIDGADSADHPGRQFAVNIWAQVAEVFVEYDERLIFETLNEPRHEGGRDEWWGGTQEVRDNINYINQAVVDTIRATGGSNAHRIIMVPTQAAGASPNALRDVKIPDDPMNTVNKFILSIHTYSPFNWAHEGHGEYDDSGLGEIVDNLSRVKQTADRLGVPVVLGEWGSVHIGRDDDAQALRDEQRVIHAGDYVREARARGMVTLWWDNGGFSGREHTWGIIPRAAPHEVTDLSRQIIEAIMANA